MNGKGKKKPVVVFVHGFGSSKECWISNASKSKKPSRLADFAMEDEELNSKFDFEFFEYDTPWFNYRPWNTIPSLNTLAGLLRTFLSADRFSDKDIVLVGHSQGGLVIQAYLIEKVEEGESTDLKKIRQVMIFATPNRGSEFIGGLRKFIYRVTFNPQERILRVLNEEIHKLSGKIKERILDADITDMESGEIDYYGYPVPIQAYGGASDGIVKIPSAKGPFGDFWEVPGNHFTILRPKNNHSDDRFLKFKENLLDSPGHKHVFEIEHYHTNIRVISFKEGVIDVEKGMVLDKDGGVVYKGENRRVETQTVGYLNRELTFAKRNRCLEKDFEIRYATLKKGLVLARHNPKKNRVKSKDEGIYEREGVSIHFKFRPERDSSTQYNLDLEIYKGFDGNNQNAHFHLGKGTHRFRKLTYSVDLSGIINDGRQLVASPILYFNSEEPDGGCTDVCQNPDPRDVVEIQKNEENTWNWVLEDVRGGIVSIIWEVQ